MSPEYPIPNVLVSARLGRKLVVKQEHSIHRFYSQFEGRISKRQMNAVKKKLQACKTAKFQLDGFNYSINPLLPIVNKLYDYQ